MYKFQGLVEDYQYNMSGTGVQEDEIEIRAQANDNV